MSGCDSVLVTSSAIGIDRATMEKFFSYGRVVLTADLSEGSGHTCPCDLVTEARANPSKLRFLLVNVSRRPETGNAHQWLASAFLRVGRGLKQGRAAGSGTA